MPQQLSVVLGEFCAVLRLGLRAVLSERDCVIVAEGERDAGLRAAVADGVDAVLLDLDAPTCADDAHRLLAQSPGLRVIGCSAARPALRVFGDGVDGNGASVDERRLDPATLVAAVGGTV